MRDQSRQPSDLHDHRSVLAYDIETVSTAETPAGEFPPWPTHRPVAVGFAKADCPDGSWIFELEALVIGKLDEAALVRETDKRLAAATTTTTFNGRGFDAPVLRMAAQRNRLFDLKALAAHAHSNRFGAEHADLADLYSGYGGTRKVSLSAICEQLGIPVKTSTSGGDVAALWKAGDVDRIRDYVLEDAVATLIAWFMWSAFRVADEALVTRPLAALAQHIEATPTLRHLQPFVACDLMQWARPRALRAEVAAALDRATKKLARQEDERSFIRS